MLSGPVQDLESDKYPPQRIEAAIVIIDPCSDGLSALSSPRRGISNKIKGRCQLLARKRNLRTKVDDAISSSRPPQCVPQDIERTADVVMGISISERIAVDHTVLSMTEGERDESDAMEATHCVNKT